MTQKDLLIEKTDIYTHKGRYFSLSSLRYLDSPVYSLLSSDALMSSLKALARNTFIEGNTAKPQFQAGAFCDQNPFTLYQLLTMILYMCDLLE